MDDPLVVGEVGCEVGIEEVELFGLVVDVLDLEPAIMFGGFAEVVQVGGKVFVKVNSGDTNDFIGVTCQENNRET